MSILARNVIPLTLSARNVLLTIFLLLLVIALFFIPEIVNLHNSLSGTPSSTTTENSNTAEAPALVSSEALTSQRAPVVQPQPSALDRILLLLDSGYLQQPAKEEQAVARAIEQGSAVAPLQSQSQPLRSSDLLDEGRITWDKLRSREVVKVFKDAEKSVAQLLTTVKENNRATVYALLNYRNALQWMANGGDRSVSADDAVNYIEKLDIEVTRAMLSEHVERADYILWTNVSLGAVLEGSKALALKQKNIAPFNPRLTITSLMIQESKPNADQRARHEAPRQAVAIKGFVVGRDIKGGIEILRNGVRVGMINLSGINEFGMRTFNNNLGRFDGVISFKITSSEGDHFTKNYRFFPLVRRFVRNEYDWYQMPFDNTEPSGDPRDIDTRLDRFFRVGSPFGRGNTGFFGGSEVIGKF